MKSATSIPRESYPLTWPPRQLRTPDGRRRSALFKATFGRARDDLARELNRMGVVRMIISTDVPLRRDGLPYADGDPVDPGVAVYFARPDSNGDTQDYVIACDTYKHLCANVRAVGLTVEALRTIERHGGNALMEQAFTGFAALPAHIAEASWWDVLEVSPEASLAEIEVAHKRLTQLHHPDLPDGNHEKMARINRARDIAWRERQDV